MTITALSTITPRVWRGYSDPGLPVGAYIASQTVTGDASGGSEIISFEFALEGAPVSGFFYNIEQITAHVTGAVSPNGNMTATNWESIGPTGLATRVWRTSFISDGVSLGGISAETLPQFPIFLGTPQPVPALASDFAFHTANVLNRVLFAQIQGYVWQPRSVNVDGGLRRPIEALYG